jgi:Recombination endonuclease VII
MIMDQDQTLDQPQIRCRSLVAPPGRCRQGADHRLFPQKDGARVVMSKGSERVKLWRLRNPDRARDAQAVTNARRRGYEPPSQRERDCPQRPPDGLCWLCWKPAAKLYRNHDHSTGAFRGWLCFRCGSLIGNVTAIGLSEIRDFLSGNLPRK